MTPPAADPFCYRARFVAPRRHHGAGWLEHLQHTERSPATVTNYRDIVNYYIVPRIGRVKLTELAPRHVEKMQRDILTAGKSARTAAALAEPVTADHREKQSMSVDQIRKLLKAASGKKDEAAVVMLVTPRSATGRTSRPAMV